jgi:hypothetical protein
VAGVYLFEAPSPPRFSFDVVSGQIQSVKLMQNWSPTEPDIPPTLHCIRTYSIHSHREGGGRGGELNQREGERGNAEEYRSQSLIEITNMTECTQETGYLQSTNSDKHVPQSPLTGQFF